jgi:SAM-dependent methyltransferase
VLPDTHARRHSFDRNASSYAAARPPYPDLVYRLLTSHCGLGPGSRVLELGPGTGQATAELLARGADVVAVEPGHRLAAILAERLGNERLTVVVDDFESAELPAGPYHLAVAATAFHWLDPSVALPKLARLLAPDGWLIVWWTVFGDPDRPTSFRTLLNPLYQRYLPHERRTPASRPGPLQTASWTAELQRDGWFGRVDADLIRWTHRLTATDARNLWGSFPNVNELDAARREAFLNELAGIVERLGGAVDDPYVTALYRTRPAPPAR